jgi:predicted dehydrogenase
MDPTVDRRQFLEISAAASLGMVASVAASPQEAGSVRPVRVGVVGTGGRGRSLLRTLTEFRWPAKYLSERNADQYPTHSLGPVLSWLDIPCGDNYRYLTSTATSSLGVNAYFARKFGPDHPAAKKKYSQGDIVTTVIKTERGRSIVINYDMQLPRPYDNRWTVQGTMGIYNEQRKSVYLQGRSPKYHEWEPFAPYQDEYDHRLWRQLPEKLAAKGHGGTDALELREFLRAVRHKTQTPIDVYESVLMSCIVPLSEQSIAQCSAPVECPDFTRGKWKRRKPTFAIEA